MTNILDDNGESPMADQVNALGLIGITRVKRLQKYTVGSNPGGGDGVVVFGRNCHGLSDRRTIYKWVCRTIGGRPRDTGELTHDWHVLRAAGLVDD